VPDFPKKAWFYIAGIIVLGAGLAAWQLWDLELSGSFLLAWSLLVLMELICELYEVEIVHGHRTSAAIAVSVAAILVGGVKFAAEQSSTCVAIFGARIL